MTAAVVLAGGRGERMHSAVPKQYICVYDKPVLYYSLKAFEDSEADAVVLVTASEDIEMCRREIAQRYDLRKIIKIVAGGKERYDSVYSGLLALKDTGCDYVLIHDGARPMITRELINSNILCVKKYGACVTAVPSKDTVKLSDGDGFAAETPDRSLVWQMKTPQSFRYEMILDAYEKRALAGDDKVTDDAMVAEKFAGQKVRLLMGDYRNIKVTTPDDLTIVRAFMGEI